MCCVFVQRNGEDWESMGRDEKEDTTTMSEVIGTREKWADAGEVTSVRIHILMPYDPATKRVCWGACIKWIT